MRRPNLLAPAVLFACAGAFIACDKNTGTDDDSIAVTGIEFRTSDASGGTMTRTGSARIPIDPMSALNPDPLTPGPIQPERTTMMVNVNLRPWIYRYNTMTIGGSEF